MSAVPWCFKGEEHGLARRYQPPAVHKNIADLQFLGILRIDLCFYNFRNITAAV
jgi:hypothetical protein